MSFKTKIKSLVVASTLCFIAAPSFSTIVVFETSQGDIEVNLFDTTTPKTVANFLTYVNESSYNTTVIHRSIPNFVVQGGGFTFNGIGLVDIADNGTIDNEPLYSNVAGTIAMAKISGNPDSASNQWFFNTVDNSTNLDSSNGGFTVFGQVVSGMETLEAIQALTHCGETALADFTIAQCSDGSVIAFDNLVSITNIDISDATVDTASVLSPVFVETEIEPQPDVEPETDSGSSSGGGIGLLALFASVGLLIRRKYK